MRIARTAIIGSVALLWVLVSSHCLFESVPGMDFFSCVDTAEHTSDESHGCDEECCPVEFGDYQVQRLDHDLILHCVLLKTPSENTLNLEQSLRAEVCVGILTAAPPESCKTWQFLFRTALPVRAPSVVS